MLLVYSLHPPYTLTYPLCAYLCILPFSAFPCSSTFIVPNPGPHWRLMITTTSRTTWRRAQSTRTTSHPSLALTLFTRPRRAVPCCHWRMAQKVCTLQWNAFTFVWPLYCACIMLYPHICIE